MRSCSVWMRRPRSRRSTARKSILPLREGVPERQTHNYRRNGATDLFAALNVAEGTVIGECHKRHRAKEFLAFLRTLDRSTPPELDLHLTLDNLATHKTARVKRWVLRHPRFHFHFVPTSSSWLNQVERWFNDLTQRRIRRGTYWSEHELIEARKQYVDTYNEDPRPFRWRATADQILAKVRWNRLNVELAGAPHSSDPLITGRSRAQIRPGQPRDVKFIVPRVATAQNPSTKSVMKYN